MKTAIGLVWYMVLVYGRTSRLSSLDDAVQTLTNHFCPRIEPFTCDVNTRGVDFSPCCSGCSCDESCTLYDNCCFDNHTSDEVNQESILSCLFTNTKREHTSDGLKYRFVVKPPPDGCIAPGSCQLPEKYIPWKTFDPVYSDTTKRNYVTEECAKCHGINDGLHWNNVITVNSANSFNIVDLIGIIKSGDSNKIYVDFFHPIEGPEGYRDICAYLENEECEVAGTAITKKRRFLIGLNEMFPGISIDDEEFRRLCKHGPKTNFVYKLVSHKNIFCAFCSYVLPTGDCSYTGMRTDGPLFVELLDFDSTSNAVSTDVSSKESSIPMACKITNQSDCRVVFCPDLRVRTQDGDCRFAARRLKVNGLQIHLRLTASYNESIDIRHAFPNSSDRDIKKLFYHMTPWDKDWHIINLAMRYTSTDETGTIEFVLELASEVTDIDTQAVMKSIKSSLNKSWVVKTPVGRLGLQQNFLEYGADKEFDENEKRLWPLESAFEMLDLLEDIGEHQVKRSLEDFISFRPHWDALDHTILIWKRNKVPLIITKLFFCDQVEIDIDENEQLLFSNRVLWLKSENRLMFRGEFSTKRNINGSIKTVKICVEDFDSRVNLINRSFRRRNLAYLITICLINILINFII